MRRRNAVSLVLLLGALSAVLVLPATAWLARLEMKTAIGMVHPAVADAMTMAPERMRAVVAADPTDFDLAYAAAIRQAGQTWPVVLPMPLSV